MARTVDQILTVTANAAITLSAIRAIAVAAKKVIRDHIGQLAKLTHATENLADVVARLDQRVTALERLIHEGTAP